MRGSPPVPGVGSGLAALAAISLAALPAPAQEADEGARELPFRDDVEAEIGPGETDVYTVEPDAGSFVLVLADERGADVEVRVVDPVGEEVERFDAPGDGHGIDPVILTETSAGRYRLEVTLDGDGEEGADPERGAYAMRLERLEPVATTPEARVAQALAAWDRPDEPGAAAAVVRGGEIVFARGMGRAALEHDDLAITPATVFDIGSVSKQLTNFAIVLLAREGRLSLDDDIRTHLPEVPDFGDTIRVRHLVHHTSGLREIYSARAIAGWQAGDGIAQEDALRLVKRLDELNFEPGSEYLYSNTGYMLLADIVTRVTGTPFAEWMEANVFGPLAMEDTEIMAERGQVVPGAAHSYAPDGEGGWVHVFDNSGIQGAGGVYTTVGDLARWIGNFSDPAVGGAGAVRQMQERGVLADGDTLDYAFGLRIDEHRGLRRIGHGGSSAGYRASLAYYPGPDVGVVVLANRADRDPSIVRRIAEAYLAGEMSREEAAAGEEEDEEADEEEDEEGEEEEAWSPSVGELEEYAGRYLSPELETLYTLTVEDGALTGRHRRHGRFELRPAGQDEFRGPGYFARVRFVRDDEGAITGLRVSNGRVRNLWFERMER